MINNKGKQQPQPFEGEIIKREIKRKQSIGGIEQKSNTKSEPLESNKDIIPDEETEKQKQIKAFKRNSNKLLHHRNIYVLLASVGEETMNQCAKYSDIAGYMLIRKLLTLLEWLK